MFLLSVVELFINYLVSATDLRLILKTITSCLMPLLCQKKERSMQGHLLEQPNASVYLFLHTHTSLSSVWALDTTPWRCVSITEGAWCENLLQKPVPEEQKARETAWMWLQTGSRLVAGRTGYLWQQSSPVRGFPRGNQETSAMTTGISLMLSKPAQGGFLTFFSYFPSGIIAL